MSRSRPLLLTILSAVGLAMTASQDTWGRETMQAVYRFPLRESFLIVSSATMNGTVRSPTDTWPLSIESLVIRRYTPMAFDVKLGYQFRRTLESAGLDISLATQTNRFHWNPQGLKINGVPMWEPRSATDVPPAYATFFFRGDFRISPLGRVFGVQQKRVTDPAYPVWEPSGVRFSFETVNLLGGDQVYFPAFEHDTIPTGYQWTVRIAGSSPLSEEGQVFRSYHYQLLEPSEGKVFPIRWTQEFRSPGSALLTTRDFILAHKIPPPPTPSPTPHIQKRQILRVEKALQAKEEFSRNIQGTLWFDSEIGRPVRSVFQGSQVLATRVHHFHRNIEDQTTLVFDLQITGEVTYDYHDQ